MQTAREFSRDSLMCLALRVGLSFDTARGDAPKLPRLAEAADLKLAKEFQGIFFLLLDTDTGALSTDAQHVIAQQWIQFELEFSRRFPANNARLQCGEDKGLSLG